MRIQPFILATIFLFIKTTFADEDESNDDDALEYREFFDEIDINKDGKITWEELKEDHSKMWEIDTFSPADEDEDGFLSESEYDQYKQELKDFDYSTQKDLPSFEDADADGDGKISKDEAIKLQDDDDIHLAKDLGFGEEHHKNGMSFEEFVARLASEDEL